MPDLLLELLSEEIPARMQARAAEDLRKLVTDALVAEGLLYEGAVAFATPRRLALHVAGLPAKGRDQREERRGPRVGAPEEALKGFLRNAGVASAEQVSVVKDAKKGDFYQVMIEKPGRPTPQVLSELLPGLIRSFPWPKSMRWGAASREPGSLRWVRPLQSILCTFGSDQETPEIVPLLVDGLISGDTSRGHRFMAPESFRVRRFDDYVAALQAAKVVLDPARRRDIIRHDARDLAFAQGLEVIEDEALLDEVAGLVEWPVVLMGSFDEAYLDVPPEVIRATIRANQKCFVLRRGEDGALANRFVLVANIDASDGGAAIVHGNERVVRARLADATFFWDTDCRTKLEERLPRLGTIVFHEKLGSQGERVERIVALAKRVGDFIEPQKRVGELQYGGSNATYHNHVLRAASFCKADLVTEMVGEFPELQGLMGRYYALAEGQDRHVACAIEDHYRPVGPSDQVPGDPVTIAVALADKLDTLVGFWAIDEKPTGSKDPYALRRAALGVIRLVLENGLRLDLMALASIANRLHAKTILEHPIAAADQPSPADLSFDLASGIIMPLYPLNVNNSELFDLIERVHVSGCELFNFGGSRAHTASANDRLGRRTAFREWDGTFLSFFHDRLKVYLRDRGARHDLIDAVLAAGSQTRHAEEQAQPASRSTRDGGASFETPAARAPQDDEGGEAAKAGAPTAVANDDLLAVVRRVEALGAFLATEDGRNLLAATKRAANILRIEEKKDGRSYDDMPAVAELVQPEEKSLALALARASGAASEAVGREDFEGAMRALAELRPAVDAFFDKVTVNAPEPHLRENRLKLLSMLRRATREVADFSRIEG